MCPLPFSAWATVLQGVAQELVHLGNLGRDGQIDGAVANLNNKSSNNLRVDLHLSVSSLLAVNRTRAVFLTSLVTFNFLPWPT